MELFKHHLKFLGQPTSFLSPPQLAVLCSMEPLSPFSAGGLRGTFLSLHL